MTEHNAIKYAVDITRGIKRILGVDDNEQGTTRVSETITPSLELGLHPEFDFPIGIFRWSVTPSIGASVGNFSTVGVFNPVGSGFIVVVDAYEPVPTAATTYQSRIFTSSALPFTSSSTPTQRDLRISNFPNPGLVTQSFADQRAAQFGTNVDTHIIPINTDPIIWNIPVILLPGFGFQLGPNVTNVAVQVNFYGREYRANPGELLAI